MPRKRIVTDAQVKELWSWLDRGASLQKAAMKANMDRKTARKYRANRHLPSERARPRTYRTRPDPLALVWPELEQKLLAAPRLQANTLWQWLQRTYPGRYAAGVRRTLERRVRQWKALHGPAQEVFFDQVHEPGRLGASDFTHMKSLQITIAGQPFEHLVYHFVLTYSNWEYVSLCFSESFASLSRGFQDALTALGGVPARHRTDRMTLAVHQDGNAERFTAKYRSLLEHYQVAGEATNAYSGHENGDCEQSHRRFKESVAQALLLRGSRDFATQELYWSFILEVVGQGNAGRHEKLAEELPLLGALPQQRLETRERLRVRVSRGSTIRVQNNVYSVPSRLRGAMVDAWLGAGCWSKANR